MLDYNKNTDYVLVRKGDTPIKRVYFGDKLVYIIDPDAQSCYGTGIWRDDLPWLDDDIWIYE